MPSINKTLPIPDYFDRNKAASIWKVDYGTRARDAKSWAATHNITPAAEDELRICILAVDIQNTFCLPEFDLFVRGRSGTGAIDDVVRFSEFIYRNLGSITKILPTLDSHQSIQIFHPRFLTDQLGSHPGPFTIITEQDVKNGLWKINPAILEELGITAGTGQEHLVHYTGALGEQGKFLWTVWPYHALIGSIGHALVPLFEESLFFHGIARETQPEFLIKGDDPMTEHYSVFGPEVCSDSAGKPIGNRNQYLVQELARFDKIIIGGEARSHCVAWTIADLIADPMAVEEGIPGKLYILEDCSSPVVIPDVVDYTETTERIFSSFESRGVKRVKSLIPIKDWP